MKEQICEIIFNAVLNNKTAEFAEKLEWAAGILKSWPLVHCCLGYNIVVQRLEKDNTIVYENGRMCDLWHCISPPQTKDEIVKYFMAWDSDGQKLARAYWDSDHEIFKIIVALKTGKKVFDDRGCLIKEDLE